MQTITEPFVECFALLQTCCFAAPLRGRPSQSKALNTPITILDLGIRRNLT